MSVKAIKRKLTPKPKRTTTIPTKDLLSTGSTRLNLACSGNPLGGFPKGKYILLVGDSSSGKTALSLTMLAEASINKEFDGYQLIHDDIEGGALFNIKKLFGRKLANRIKFNWSESLEACYDNLDEALDSGKPCIYIVDSMDSLDPLEDEKKYEENKTARKKGKETKGTYGTAKAKINSTCLRRIIPKLKRTKSILVIVSQTRDNLGFGFETKTRSGGKALKFYASLEVWSSVKKKITKTVNGKTYVTGIMSTLKVKKNRVTGQDREVEVPIYYSVGFDDTGSCIDYLVEQKHWKQVGGKIKATEFEVTLSREALIRFIENKGQDAHKSIQCTVGEVWNEIEAACAVRRKSRYD